jgi:hypothetical protein
MPAMRVRVINCHYSAVEQVYLTIARIVRPGYAKNEVCAGRRIAATVLSKMRADRER